MRDHNRIGDVMATAKTPEDDKLVVAPPVTSSVHLDAAIFGASVQLPNFDKVEPETWFTVADVNFDLRKVTDATMKYYYVLSKLDATKIRKLSAFLKQPRGSDPYREIKKMLREAYEPPLEQKLDALLAVTDIGDERPREFGLDVQRLASDGSLDDVLKRIFIRCLPQRIVTVITGSLGGKLQTVIAAADKVWTAAATSGSATASVSAIAGPPVSASRRGGRSGLSNLSPSRDNTR